MGGKKPEVTSYFLQSPKPPHEKSATTVTEAQHPLVQGTQYHVLAPLMSVLTPGPPQLLLTPAGLSPIPGESLEVTVPFHLTVHATEIGVTPCLVSSLSKQDFNAIPLGILFLAPVTATSGLWFVQEL